MSDELEEGSERIEAIETGEHNKLDDVTDDIQEDICTEECSNEVDSFEVGDDIEEDVLLEYDSENESSIEEEEVIEDIEESDDIQRDNKLSDQERKDLSDETGWSKEIIENIETPEQADIYKNAKLTESEINDHKCLVKAINLDYVDVKTGKSNRELMGLGRPPVDEVTGEKIELHHMGQEHESPFAELCENSEHGNGNDTILHDKKIESWRQNEKLKNYYNNVDRPSHWKERLKKIEKEV